MIFPFNTYIKIRGGIFLFLKNFFFDLSYSLSVTPVCKGGMYAQLARDLLESHIAEKVKLDYLPVLFVELVERIVNVVYKLQICAAVDGASDVLAYFVKGHVPMFLFRVVGRKRFVFSDLAYPSFPVQPLVEGADIFQNFAKRVHYHVGDQRFVKKISESDKLDVTGNFFEKLVETALFVFQPFQVFVYLLSRSHNGKNYITNFDKSQLTFF